MTFTELQDSVADRLNLTSSDALARIGRNINDRYRRVTSSVGLQTSRRAEASANTVADDPRLSFTLEKIEVVYCVASGKRRVLDERTYDEWRNHNTLLPATGDPMWYAIEENGASTVSIVLYPTPGEIIALKADGLENASTLSGAAVPAFPADYHDTLMFGAIADEYYKLDKPGLAQQFEMQFEMRVADLRLFLAKSTYLSVHQGSRSSLSRRPFPRRNWID